MIDVQDIHIRDPFVLCDHTDKTYYMYGTTDKDCWKGPGVGFDVYVSSNLKTWDGPFAVFRPGTDFWGKENFWAPEVHAYRGNYYMFASFKADDVCRGTAILRSDSPQGPFVEHSRQAVTPANWECLDGTLHVDDQEQLWIVFCHEWTQIHNGAICAAKLSPDLTEAVSDPTLLFKAGDSSWAEVCTWEGQQGYVSDGPFLMKHEGKLLMLWSSFHHNEYAIGVALSDAGGVLGPWLHHPDPIYVGGGHCMVFDDLDGRKVLSFHQPNSTPDERPLFLELERVLKGVV